MQMIEAAYLRPTEAARYLSVSTRTLREWTAKGVLGCHKLSHRCVLFSVKDLEKAMGRYRVNAVEVRNV